MRRALPKAACFAVLAALLLAAPGSAGKAKKARPGDYSAILVAPPGDYIQGRFTVVKAKGGKRAIVPSADFTGIHYPDANECESLTAPLVAERVRINRRGRFSIREQTKADKGDLVVRWTGRWRSPRAVAGKIVVRYGDCVSRLRWTGTHER